MNKRSILIIAAICIIVFELQSQELVNGIDVSNLYIEMENSKIIEAHADAVMVLAYTPVNMKLYQDGNYTYWVEFDFKQCGKKAKLKSRTYLELKNGEIIAGQTTTERRKLDKGEKDWIVGNYQDEFKIDKKDDVALNAGFNYALRFRN
jgi:hypothetical protein